MDRRRAAGALLALAACIVCSAAAPTASNHTALDLYEGAKDGCYYNFQHYGEGDRIMTNEPCLNCTCHNRMLMCYLRVCPFTKPIGQDCTVEKRADQCCPIVTCPDVPVDLLTSTSTSSPAEYGATGLGKVDKYGCSMNGKYFPEGSKVPPTPNKPCEHCYCIRNMTTCVMQECTLHVDGCTPIYHKDVCCPVRYSCDHPEDEVPLLDDMSTTVRPTPGFLLTTTTLSPVTQMSQDCIHNDQIIPDGASITTEKACEHCYCMKGDIVCVVQECGAPMENEGKNCTSLPPREGQCCPDTYICDGDESSTETPKEFTTDTLLEKITTLSPPRRTSAEGSGYRNEPNEVTYTESPTVESELEGSGQDQDTITPSTYETISPEMPLQPEEYTPAFGEQDQYIPVTTKTPIPEMFETSTKDIDRIVSGDNLERETDEPQKYIPTTQIPTAEKVDKINEVADVDDTKPHGLVTASSASVTESLVKITTESSEYLNTVPDIVPEQEQPKLHEHTSITTGLPSLNEIGTDEQKDDEKPSESPLHNEQDFTASPIAHETSKYEYPTLSSESSAQTEKDQSTQIPPGIVSAEIEKETSQPEIATNTVTGVSVLDERETLAPQIIDSTKLEEYATSTTNIPVKEIENLTTEPDHAQNTIAVAEEESISSQHPSLYVLEGDKDISSPIPMLEKDDHTTVEPDKGLNTIPSEINEETTQPSLTDKFTTVFETKSTEPSIIVNATKPQEEDIKLSTASESRKPLLDDYTAKVNQNIMTTEASFRREDEASVSTEKTKEEIERTTIKTEFIDEGLIPTHSENIGAGSDIPSIDEYITTILPDYKEESEETVASAQPVTDSIPASVSDHATEKITDAIQEEQIGMSSTEKILDVVTEDNRHKELSRIPGEGDCLVNAITYRNNIDVPSTDKCQTGCKCISSIVKCNPIICSPPPDYVNNCKSIYDTPESCCPTYICDYPKETVPPKSDSQMSGTESPMLPPTIECRGDQCELSEHSLEFAKPCASGDCLHELDHKLVSNECGPLGCDAVKELSPQPSVEQTGCVGDNCLSLPTHSEFPSTQLCEGDNCKVADDGTQKLKPCTSKDECEKIGESIPQTTSCEGDSCTNVDCGGHGCDSDGLLKPQDSSQQPCKDKTGCQPQKFIPTDCVGDEPCRRKDISIIKELPTKCEGSHCAVHPGTPATPISTSEEVPVKQIPSEEKPSEQSDIQILEHGKTETTPIVQTPTEKEYTPTVQSPYETTDTEMKTEQITDKADLDIATEGLIVTEVETTKKPDHSEQEGMVKPLEEDTTTMYISIKNEGLGNSLKEEQEGVTYNPNIIEDERTDKYSVTIESVTKTPHEHEEKYTGEPIISVALATEKPKDDVLAYTDKPDSIEESTGIADVTITDKSISTEEETTKSSDSFEMYTDKPAMTDVEGTNIPDHIVGEDKGKPALTEDTKLPTLVEEQSDKQTLLEGQSTEMPNFNKVEDTDKPTLINEKDKTIYSTDKEHDYKPVSVDSQDSKVSDKESDSNGIDITNRPDAFEQKPTEHPELMQGIEDKIPVNTNTEKSSLLEQENLFITDVTQTTKPKLEGQKGDVIPNIIVDEQTEKTTVSEEKTTKAYDTEDIKYTDRNPSIADISTMTSEIIDDTYTNKPESIEEQVTTRPSPDQEEQSYEPDSIGEDGTKTPELIIEHTDKTMLIYDSNTKISDVLVDDNTDKPHLIGEEGTSDKDIEKQTSSPVLVEDTIPDSDTDKTTTKDHEMKPILVDEDLPEKITPVKEDDKEKIDENEGISQSVISEAEGTETPEITEHSVTKLIDESTESLPKLEVDKVTKIPSMTEEGVTDELMLPEDKIKDKPVTLGETTEGPYAKEKDHTPGLDKEIISETLAPDTQTQHTVIDHHKVTDSSQEEGSGIEESEEIFTTKSEDEHVTSEKSQTDHTNEYLPELTSEYPEIQKPEPVEIVSLDHGVDEQAETTKVPFDQKEDETYRPLENITPYQELLTYETTELPKLIPTQISVSKFPEHDIINNKDEIYTGMPEQSSATKSPELMIIEPQDGEKSEAPQINVVSSIDDESATTVVDDTVKDDSPESPIPQSSPTYDHTSSQYTPEIMKNTETAESADEVTQKTILYDTDAGKQPTQIPVQISEQEIKTIQPDILTHEKISTIEFAVTEPVKIFTEIEDTFVTGQEQTTTKYYNEFTERTEQSTTDKPNQSLSTLMSESDMLSIADENTSKGPEEPLTEHHQGYTEITFVTKDKLPETYVTVKPETSTRILPDISTITESSDTFEYSKPAFAVITETSITDLPVTQGKDTEEYPVMPVQNNIHQEDKSTNMPDFSDQTLLSTPTGSSETYVTEEQISTQTPQSHKTTASQENELNSEEPQIINEAQKTIIPQTKPDYTTSKAELFTNLPDAQLSTEVPSSIIADKQPGIGVSIESITEKDHIQSSPHETVTESQEKMTEQSVVKAQLTTTKPVEEYSKFTHVTLIPDKLSETTPYLIELEEHTHKIIEEIATTSNLEEAEYTHKEVEEISTQSPSKESDSLNTEQDMQPLPINQDTVKVEDSPSTTLPTAEDHDIFKEASTISSLIGTDKVQRPEGDLEKPEILSTTTTEVPTTKILEQKVEVVTQQSEVSTKFSGDKPSDTFGPESYQTTLSTLEEVSEKELSAHAITTVRPPIQDLEEITLTIPSKTEKVPVSDSAIEVTTETKLLPTEIPMHPSDILIASDKTIKPEDELMFSTTEVNLVKDEGITPLVIDKDDKPDEKPSSDVGEVLPHVSEDKYGKPDLVPSSQTEEMPPSDSEDKIVKPNEKPISESEDIMPPVSGDIDSKYDKKPSIQTDESMPPVSEDKYGKPELIPSSETDKITPEVPVDKYDKPDKKPSSETEENPQPDSADKAKPHQPSSEIISSSTTSEMPKPLPEAHPSDDLPVTEEEAQFPPSGTGYGEPDYVEEDQAFGPGTCRYGGKVYVSAQQIPRDDPCDFCFCFRSDIICLQQSCPPPIHGCHEEPISGFCCPRYECPVSMATTVNVTTTTTTTTTTLPPHFPTHSYKGAVQRRGCQIKGHTYKVGEVVRSSSGPCLHCTCGGDGQMKCDPKACTPEPMLRQMIAAAVSAKRRR